MTIKLIDSQAERYAPAIESARRFVDAWVRCTDLGGNRIAHCALAGSHAKGLNNSRSDFDVMIYYAFTVQNILRVRRHTLSTHPKPPLEPVEREAVTYGFEGSNYETILTALRTLGGGDRDLWTGLARQNADTVFKFLRAYELSITPPLCAVRRFMLDEFRLEPEAVFGYFDGYGTSQLLRHKKESSGDRRKTIQARVDEVVKSIIEGVGMLLSGTLLLDRQEISFSFASTLRRYEGEIGDSPLLWMFHDHKTDVRRIDSPIDEFLVEADLARERLLESSRRLLKRVKESSNLSPLSESDKRFNQERLDDLFLAAHDLTDLPNE